MLLNRAKKTCLVVSGGCLFVVVIAAVLWSLLGILGDATGAEAARLVMLWFVGLFLLSQIVLVNLLALASLPMKMEEQASTDVL